MALTFTSFDAPGAGTSTAQGTFPTCLNSIDTCAGTYSDSSNKQHGFIRLADGTLTQFDAPSALNTYVVGINDSNTTCGWYEDGSHNDRGFIRASDGTFTTFVYPAGIDLILGNLYLENAGFSVGVYVGNCINNNGDVTGTWRDGAGTWHAFIRSSAGSFTTFDLAGDYHHGITLTSINSAGDVAGNYLVTALPFGDYYKSFIRKADGTLIQYATPSAGTHSNNGTIGYLLNDSQDVSGYYADSSGLYHGFIRKADGTFVEYDVPGTTSSTLGTCINGAGDVSGWYENPSTPPFWTHGYLRTAAGTFTTFDPGGDASVSFLDYPYGINGNQTLIGSYTNDDTDDIVHGFISVAPGPFNLTITANNQTKAYGTVFTFTGTEFTASGLQGGDTITHVDLVSNGSPAQAHVGSYPIVPSNATGTGLEKYTITYVNGTMTVVASTAATTPYVLESFNFEIVPIHNL